MSLNLTLSPEDERNTASTRLVKSSPHGRGMVKRKQLRKDRDDMAESQRYEGRMK
jgi:hypothetical protein